MSLRLGLETLGAEGAREFRFVGGSSRYPYWTRLLAAVIGRPLTVSTRPDLSARGAALLGAHAAGLAPATDAAESGRQVVDPAGLDWLEDYYGSFQAAYQKLRA